MSIPILAPKPRRPQAKPESTRRGSMDGVRPPSRSERLLRDALDRDTTARKPSSDHHSQLPSRAVLSSPPPTGRKMSSTAPTKPRMSPTSPRHSQQQLPLTPHELQLRTRLQGTLKRSETESQLSPDFFQSPYVSKPYPSPPSSTTTASDDAIVDPDSRVAHVSPQTQRVPRRLSRTHARSTSVPPTLPPNSASAFSLAMPLYDAQSRANMCQQTPVTPPVDFDPVIAAAHCSQMSGYVSFSSVIPPPSGNDDDEAICEPKATSAAPAFWNWWTR